MEHAVTVHEFTHSHTSQVQLYFPTDTAYNNTEHDVFHLRMHIILRFYKYPYETLDLSYFYHSTLISSWHAFVLASTPPWIFHGGNVNGKT